MIGVCDICQNERELEQSGGLELCKMCREIDETISYQIQVSQTLERMTK